MSQVISVIRDKIRYHEEQIDKLKRMLEVGGAEMTEGSLSERILRLLATGPLSAADLIARLGDKPGSVYTKLSRMRQQGLVSNIEGAYSLPEEP